MHKTLPSENPNFKKEPDVRWLLKESAMHKKPPVIDDRIPDIKQELEKMPELADNSGNPSPKIADYRPNDTLTKAHQTLDAA